MEDLTQKMDELIEAVNSNSVPLWLTVFCMIVPIIISLAVAVFAVIQHYQNKGLQKSISDKELRVQMHGDILNIYDGYCVVHNTLGKADNAVAKIFVYPNILSQWMNDLQNSAGLICQAYNRAELLLPKSDRELRNILKTILEKYYGLMNDVFEYINSGAADLTRNQTWTKIAVTHALQINDYSALYNNKNATADFVKLYSNSTTDMLDNKLKELMDLFNNDKFDKYFEPYLSMYMEKGD